MPLLRLTNVSIAFGTHALLKNADFQLDAGERVGLLGRNGEGKSTLMKIIAGNIHADSWRDLAAAGIKTGLAGAVARLCPMNPPSMMPSPAVWVSWARG